MKNFKMLFGFAILLGFYSCTEDVVTQSLIVENAPDSLQQIIDFKNSLNPETNPEELFGVWELIEINSHGKKIPIDSEINNKITGFDFKIIINGETFGDKLIVDKFISKNGNENIVTNKGWKLSTNDNNGHNLILNYSDRTILSVWDINETEWGVDKIKNFRLVGDDILYCSIENPGIIYTEVFKKILDK